MRLVVMIILSVMVYGLALLGMDQILHVKSESAWYWLPYGLSGLTHVGGAFVWSRRLQTRPIALWSGIMVSLLVAFGADLVVGIMYSCSKGVCL